MLRKISVVMTTTAASVLSDVSPVWRPQRVVPKRRCSSYSFWLLRACVGSTCNTRAGHGVPQRGMPGLVQGLSCRRVNPRSVSMEAKSC